MNCISCNTLNRPNAQFCIECGAYLVTKENCSACGKLNRTNSNFCIDCGSSLNKIGYTHKSIYSINEFINLLGAYNKEFPHVKFFILSLVAVTFVILTAVQLNINYAYISNGFKGGIAYFENFSISSENKPDFHASVQKELFSNASKNNNIVIQLPKSTRAIKDLFGISASDGQFKTGKTAMTSIWFEQSFQHGNDSLHVVFLKTQSLDERGEVDGHRASAPLISAASYKKANNDWLLISKQINFTTIGQFGEAPEINQAEVERIHSDKSVFLVNSGYSAMGYSEEGKVLLIFENNSWKDAGFILTSSDNSGTCGLDLSPCYHFDGNMSFSSDKKDFPDIYVTKAGSELDNQQKIIVAGTDTYVFDGNKYELHENKGTDNLNHLSYNQYVKNMLEGSIAHDEQKIQDNKLKLEKLPKPPRGDKKKARKANDDALIYIQNQQFVDAVKLLENATDIDPADIEIIENYGYALLKANNITQAELVIEKSIAMNPGRASSWATLGQILGLKGDSPGAIASFSNAFRFSRNRLKTHQFLTEANVNETSSILRQARDSAIQWAEINFPEIILPAGIEDSPKAETKSINLPDETNSSNKPASASNAEMPTSAQEPPQQPIDYSAYMRALGNKVKDNWVQNNGYTQGLKCTIQVKLLPSGEVMDAIVIRSNGDSVFDRSAENAVRKASPLPVPRNKVAFNQQFRNFNLIFPPD